MFEKSNPSIGLLSVGVEENKGNRLTQETYKLLMQDKKLNFIGNVEARDLTYGVCDIVVTDGFAGNVFLKTYEGTATLLLKLIKEQISSSFISKIGGLMIKPAMKKILKKYDATIYGGAPILGANGLIIKCHGNAKKGEFASSIKQTKNLLNKNLIKNLNDIFMR
jgi:glycerol-3-phosphate acyltransferase PlsX